MSSTFTIEASQVINARPEELYAVIADYRVAHQAILPRPPFIEMLVVKGGQGAGTETRLTLKEPGRTIVETDVDTGQYSRFIFEPLNGGKQTKMTIFSEFPASPGLMGFVEKLMQPAFIRRVYQQELRNIAEYVREKQNSPMKAAT